MEHEHSRLLKFLLPDGFSNQTKMADSVNIADESNVEAEVPIVQTIRKTLNNENGECEVSEIDTFHDEPAIKVTRNEVTLTKGDLKLQKVTVTEDISMNFQHLFRKQTTPGKTHHPENQSVVIKVTQNQSHSSDDNDDRKRTKIPVSKFRQTVEKVTADRRGSRENEAQNIRRSSIPKPTRPAPAKPERKSIPKLKLKEKLAIKLITTATKKPETTEPEDEFDKLYEQVVHSPVNIDISLLNPKVDDPEKVENTFEEIIHDYDENKVKPIDVDMVKKSKIPFLKRQSLQEDRNSKIIAARDKVRLRNNSTMSDPDTNYEDVNNDHNSKEVKEGIFESNGDSKDNEFVITHTKTVITSRANGEDDTIEIVGKATVTEVETIDSSDTVEPIKGQIIVENIQKEFVKVGIPVFESHVLEYTEKIEGENKVEVKNILAFTTNNDDLEIVYFNNDIDKIDNETGNFVEITEINDGNTPTSTENAEPNVNSTENDLNGMKPETMPEEQIDREDETHMTERDGIFNPLLRGKERPLSRLLSHETLNKDALEIESGNKLQIDREDTHMPERDGIFNPLLRGKERPLSRLLSHETINKDALEIESGNKLPKKESVMSKIALFERQEPVKSKIPKKDSSLPKLTTGTLITEKVHVHTPLIVDEIYKFDSTIGLNNKNNEFDSTTNRDEDVSEIFKADMVIMESPELVRFDKENNFQRRTSNMIVEKAAVKEEVLSPVLRKLEPKRDENRNENNRALNDNDLNKTNPKAIPKFIPVREVLKRYESLSEQNQYKKPVHIPKRSISEMRSIPKPDGIQKSLDFLFVHHEKPVSDILKDIHTADIKDDSKKENIFFAKLSKKNTDVEITNGNLNTTTDDFNNETEFIEATEVKANNKIDKRKLKLYNFNEEFKKPELDYKTLDSGDDKFKSLEFIQDYVKAKDDMRRTKSVAELDLGDAVKGKVNKIISRINSFDLLEENNQIKVKDLPRKRSVSEKIALFERKLTPAKEILPSPTKDKGAVSQELTPDVQEKIQELAGAKKYGSVEVPSIALANGVMMPVLAVGTALLDPPLVYHVITAAIDLGYRAIDCAFIYGNEKEVGDAIRDKIKDGTVKREDLFIISKLWSTFHRTDLVKEACEASLRTMGLEYFDLYLIHNPMSFKEGGSPVPRIATVLQYSAHDYLDAWYGVEALGAKARAFGLSNFNSQQIRRVMDRARIKPVVNQVECHPYLTQQKLDNFCAERNVTLSCFGVLGSKGTPSELKNSGEAVIDDPLVQVMASGLNMTPAQLLIRYQIQCGRNVVVKASSAARLWENLQSLTFHLTEGQVDALHALNRNKRTFVFKGIGDTHKNYPFNTPF